MAERAISSLDWRGTGSAPAGSLIIRDAVVLDPRTGVDGRHDIVIRDGEIAEIAAPGFGVADDAEVIEADGRAVFPAFFDPHVHLRTPGREDKEDIETGSRAAAAGGFCGVLAMANTDPPVDMASHVGALREQAREQAAVPTGFLATVTREMNGRELSEMADLAAAGAVGFSDDGLPIQSARVMRRALQYQRLVDLPIALHEEDAELSLGGSMHEGSVSAGLGIAGVPSISESTMIARDCAIAAYEEARIHVQHLSALESVAVVEQAKASGVQVSCEATPHHLTLTDVEVRSLDSRFKINPPLRTDADRKALIEGIRSGTIDCIATDHAPHTSSEKEVPFEQAAMGVIGLETAFPVLYTELVLSGVLELATVVERLGGGAAPLGFATPRIASGEQANLVLCDLEAEWDAGAEGWESRSDNSCFAGRKLHGRILMTVAAGRVAYRQRSFAMGVAS